MGGRSGGGGGGREHRRQHSLHDPHNAVEAGGRGGGVYTGQHSLHGSHVVVGGGDSRRGGASNAEDSTAFVAHMWLWCGYLQGGLHV